MQYCDGANWNKIPTGIESSPSFNLGGNPFP
jgi:hypothetical protein